MKKDLHPTDYRPVVFQDTSSGFSFLTKSTAATTDTIEWEDGNTYPLIKVHISSQSHPFFTGEEKIVDVEGRVDKFKARTEAAKKKREEVVKRAETQSKKSASKAKKADTANADKDSETTSPKAANEHVDDQTPKDTTTPEEAAEK